ncbi:MAG: hypothetical protein AMS21_01295 [Gemmatimonas sp. SG8_38_2]|nr:MAG: hypothetical protein AMS21_01295 [Gemmatimonas sp. SG8_38_2]
MCPTPNQITVSNALLTEVARSGAFPDPSLFVYGVVGSLILAILMIGCLTAKRASGLEPGAPGDARGS